MASDPDDPTRNFHGGNKYSNSAYQRSRRNALSTAMRILDLLRDNPKGLTCEEIENRMPDVKHETISSSLTKLKKDGLVVLSGESRLTSTGSPAGVNVLVRFAPPKPPADKTFDDYW